MNNIKKGSGSEGLNEKKAYEPPKAMRLGDMRNGVGQGACFGSGSGDTGLCLNSGNSAALFCEGLGNSYTP